MKIYLGKVSNDYSDSMVAGETLYLDKHKWDCEWYWGMGYIGNTNLHTHFDSSFLGQSIFEVSKIFTTTKLTQDDWWILRDLFIQAYALKSAAAVYRYGGHQTEKAMHIIDVDMAATLNSDLKKILDEIWKVVTAVSKR